MSPLLALASRAALPRTSGLIGLTLAGLVCLAYQAGVVTLARDGQVLFWMYATSGLPAMFIGYFLLGVPAALLVVWAAAPVISRVLRLPRNLLGRTVAATPYRHGFTAGALMGWAGADGGAMDQRGCDAAGLAGEDPVS
jgi:hypothetical protein